MYLTQSIDRVATSETFQRFAASMAVQNLMYSTPIQWLRSTKPVQTVRSYTPKFASAVLPNERIHDIIIMGVTSREGFFLMRRHPNDKFEPGRLDNITGHVNPGDNYRQSAFRELREETQLDAEKLLRDGDANFNELGPFHRPMTLRTKEGPVPSFVYGRMYLLNAPKVEREHIKINPEEHVEVVTVKLPEIMQRTAELATFDSFYFRVNSRALEWLIRK